MKRKSCISLVALLLISLPVLGQSETPPAPRPDSVTWRPGSSSGKSQLFQVALVVGADSGSDSVDNLPKAAQKAIQDIREFLPYKSYRLLDAGLLRAVSDSTSSEIALKGQTTEGEREFKATLRYRERDSDGSIVVDQFVLYASPKQTRPLKEGYAPEAPNRLINTSFSIEVNETIVVGSSKLNGSGTAIIVLLTALPSS